MILSIVSVALQRILNLALEVQCHLLAKKQILGGELRAWLPHGCANCKMLPMTRTNV